MSCAVVHPGKLLDSTHAIDREYRITKSLAEIDFPVPRPALYCDDESVIGHIIQDFRRFYPKQLNNLYHGREDEAEGASGGTPYDAIAVYTVKDEDFDELITIGQDRAFQRLMTEDEALFCDRAETLEGSAEEFSGPGING